MAGAGGGGGGGGITAAGGGGGGGGGWTTAAGGGVSPFWACIKHPQPLKVNPMRATITKIPTNFVFINLSSFYLVGTISVYQYTPHKQ